MRIALVECYTNPTPDYGLLAALLRGRGHTVWLGTTVADGELSWCDGEGVVARQSRNIRLPAGLGWLRKLPIFKRLADLRFVWQMRRFLRRQRVEIVQLNPATLNWVGLLPLGMPLRFVLDWRQIAQRDFGGRLGRLKQEWATRRRFFYSTRLYDCATFLHPAGAAKVLGDKWPRWGKVVPLGVDPRFLQLQPEQVTRPAGDGAVTFLYIGTLSRVRRLERLLDAAHALLAQTGRFRIDFVGPDTAQGYYQRLAHELGLDAVVAFCPPVPYIEVPETILQHDVALAYVPAEPSDWRYHPTLKVIEYGALGVPIIASDLAPNRATVSEAVNGLLVENNPTAWAAAMLRFVTDDLFLRQCQQAAQSRRQGLLWSEIAERYEQTVYAPLLQKKPVGGRRLLAT